MGERMRQPITGYGALVILVVCLSLAAIGIAIGQAGDRKIRTSFCRSAEIAADGEQRKLTEYEQEPPTTAAGASQRDAVKESLRAWRGELERAGCPVRKGN
jgi:hypothetical protein